MEDDEYSLLLLYSFRLKHRGDASDDGGRRHHYHRHHHQEPYNTVIALVPQQLFQRNMRKKGTTTSQNMTYVCSHMAHHMGFASLAFRSGKDLLTTSDMIPIRCLTSVHKRAAGLFLAISSVCEHCERLQCSLRQSLLQNGQPSNQNSNQMAHKAVSPEKTQGLRMSI
eukprot:5595479-Amphidinium_carterae.1